MNAYRIKEIQQMIKNHQVVLPPQPQRDIPVGAGRNSDDLSKVQTTDVIGKGGESDLRK
jgi:hypothetical protein